MSSGFGVASGRIIPIASRRNVTIPLEFVLHLGSGHTHTGVGHERTEDPQLEFGLCRMGRYGHLTGLGPVSEEEKAVPYHRLVGSLVLSEVEGEVESLLQSKQSEGVRVIEAGHLVELDGLLLTGDG